MGLFGNGSFLEWWDTGSRIRFRRNQEGLPSIDLFNSGPAGKRGSVGRCQFFVGTSGNAEDQSACLSDRISVSSPLSLIYPLNLRAAVEVDTVSMVVQERQGEVDHRNSGGSRSDRCCDCCRQLSTVTEIDRLFHLPSGRRIGAKSVGHSEYRTSRRAARPPEHGDFGGHPFGRNRRRRRLASAAAR